MCIFNNVVPVSGSYPNYAAGTNPSVTYPNLSQPPPTFGYTGAYTTPSSANHTQYPASQYSGTAQAGQGYAATYTAAGYTPVAGQSQAYSNTHGGAPQPAYASATGQPSSGYVAAQPYGASSAAASHQGQWARPPPNSQGYYRR